MEAAAALAPAPVDERARSRRIVALWMLTAIGTINFVDRQLLAVLIEPIRADLKFTDTQFGLLTGIAFALFYAIVGLPAAMIADRWHRVRLIALSCLMWSGFTAASGFAQSFAQLAIARFGVGVGEAGGTAPSLSVLADYYPPEKRPLVIGIFTVSGPFGVFIGAAFGGWAAAEFGWRGAFIAIGLIGIVAAPLLLLLVREPERGATDPLALAAAREPALSLGATVGLFARSRSLTLLLVAAGLGAFVSYGMLNWIPAFLMRTQGMPLTALATWFAPAAGLSMALGIWGGGALVNRFVRTSPSAYASIPAATTALMIPTFAAALLMPDWRWSLAVMIVPMTCCTAYVAPALALAQNLTPPRARATATAMILLMFNIVGLGGGPLFVGMISDATMAQSGIGSLRIGLLALMPVAAIAVAAQYALSHRLAADAK